MKEMLTWTQTGPRAAESRGFLSNTVGDDGQK